MYYVPVCKVVKNVVQQTPQASHGHVPGTTTSLPSWALLPVHFPQTAFAMPVPVLAAVAGP